MRTGFHIPLDRLESETHNGDPVAYRYDPNGNRTEKTQGFQGGAQSTLYDYLPQSNVLAAVDNQLIVHDDAGNLVLDGQGRSYVYNGAGRLEEIRQNGQTLAEYRYNQSGQRTHKITPTQTTIYHYDLSGNLIAETHADGTPVKDYLWQNGTPIAQIDINGATETITYLHSDHLDTPRLATDPNRTLVWRWEGEAFGNTPPQESGVTVNLRFPGQYYDSESGLYYNWNRYYDPETGRYITSDPIGLDGGLNTYGYVGGNPIIFIDPLGLLRCVVSGQRMNCFPDGQMTQQESDLRQREGTQSAPISPLPSGEICGIICSTALSNTYCPPFLSLQGLVCRASNNLLCEMVCSNKNELCENEEGTYVVYH